MCELVVEFFKTEKASICLAHRVRVTDWILTSSSLTGLKHQVTYLLFFFFLVIINIITIIIIASSFLFKFGY